MRPIKYDTSMNYLVVEVYVWREGGVYEGVLQEELREETD